MRFLDKHSAREKELRRLEREMRRLWHAQLNAPIVPLERPYQRGWVKTYILDKAVLRRPDAYVFEAVLRVVKQRVYARTRAFVDRHGRPIVLRPKIIPVHDWIRLRWPASHQRLFSYGTWRLEDRPWLSMHQRACISGFKLYRDWWLHEDIQPNLITHQRVELPKVRSRLAEIEAFMVNTAGHERLARWHGRSKWWLRQMRSAAEIRENVRFAEQLRVSEHSPD